MTGAVPQRPLLAPWYRVVQDRGRLMLEYGQTVVTLEGAAVERLLPALLPLLDGTRTVEEAVRELGEAARAAIEGALNVLAANGLLTEGPPLLPPVGLSADAVAAAFNLSPAVAAERLGSAVIGVAGSSPVAALAARLLRAAGIGDVRRVGDEPLPQLDLALVAPAPAEFVAIGSWNRRALDEGLSWLPVRPFDGRWLGVGPLIVPGESCCYECFQHRRAANVDYGDDLAAIERVPVAVRCDAALEAIAAALVAHLAVRFVIGSDTTVPGVLHAIAPRMSPLVTEHPVLRLPRCPACSVAERLASRLPWHEAAAA